MLQNVVVEDLGENPPVLELSVDCLMMRPCPSLHPQALLWVAGVLGELYFVKMPNILVVCLNLLAQLQKVAKNQ